MLFNIFVRKKRRWRNELAVCLCFKDSATYLAEWLAFYRAVGVDYFYLYDNESSDDYTSIVRPYIDLGIASVKRWPGSAQQSSIYQDCLDRARGKDRWVAFMDDDEFLWPVMDTNLKSTLERYEQYAGVAACWYLYGSSHHENRPNGLVIENYTWRTWPPASSLVKCIVSPDRVISPKYVGHAFNCKPKFFIVDEKKRPITTAETNTPSGDVLRVNHYATKSREELRERRRRKRADNGLVTEHSMEMWEYWLENWNQVEDHGILKFVPRVKELIASPR